MQPEGKERQNKKFDHCCFVSMCLEDGFSNVSVKVFCTGRLQTTGCRDGSMSLLACRKISECLRKMSTDEFSTKKPLITGGFPREASPRFEGCGRVRRCQAERHLRGACAYVVVPE